MGPHGSPGRVVAARQEQMDVKRAEVCVSEWLFVEAPKDPDQ